ncbi:MAG: tetratricopeptide repeat protein [Planctomycetota bacterium]
MTPPSNSAQRAHSTSSARRALPHVVLVLAAFLVYAQSLSFGFMPIDDKLLILDRIRWLGDPSNVLAAFREGVFAGKEQNFYRPILTLSFMWDTWVGGGAALFYHLTNVLLHASAVPLVFLALQRFGARRPIAFALALLFAVHPVFAHAVAFLPGRNDPLLAIFVLSAVLAFERWGESASVVWLCVHACLFLVALLTKENAVVLVPLLVLRLWLAPQPRPTWRAVAPLAGGWLIALVAWSMLRQGHGGTSSPTHVDMGALREFVAAIVVLFGKLVAPVSQSVMPAVADTSLVPGIVAVVATLALALRAGFHDVRSAVFGLVWFGTFLFLPTLAGSLGMVMPIHHEHRLYLPAVGFFACVAQLRFERVLPIRPRVVAALVGVVFIAASARTLARSRAYATPMAFAEHAVRESLSLAVSFKMRSDVLLEEKEFERAIADAERALALRPEYAGALSNLGKAHSEAGRPAQSIEFYTRAIASDPKDLDHVNNRAVVYLTSGDSARAIADLDSVLARDPRNGKALNNRGKALIYTGHHDRAVTDLSAAIDRNADDGEAYHNRAVAWYSLKDYERAWADVERARALGIPVTAAFVEALRNASRR